ncbi:MAG: Ldh family oxidoreductase, partial [Chloroflexota bacterium]
MEGLLKSITIRHDTLEHFIYDLICTAGISQQEAEIISHIFVWFDLIGRYPQGVGRLSVYLKRLQMGLINSPCQPTFEQKSDTTWILDGHDGFGHYLGHIAMLKAVEIAEVSGIGVVAVKHSNHFGAGAYYVDLAAQHNKLGLAISNSVPSVAPYGGVSKVLGTNPLAFGAPVRTGQALLVDLSTGASAGSTVKQMAKQGKEIPAGIMINNQGNSVTSPEEVLKGIMLPFGGAKGYALGLIVEILSGIITGAAISHEIASLEKNFNQPNRVGHFFMAIDIAPLMSRYDQNNGLTALKGR